MGREHLSWFVVLLLAIATDWPIKPIAQPDKPKDNRWSIKEIVPAKTPAKKPKAVTKPSPTYTMTVKTVAKPAGWRPFNVNGDWNPSYSKLYNHVITVHSPFMPRGLTDDQFAKLTYNELWSIHSTIHCIEQGFIPSRKLGSWTTACPIDPSQPCVHTWTWEIPNP